MINSIDLRNLRNANYLQFQKDVWEIVKRNNPSVLQVEAKFTDLGAKIIEIEALFKKVMSNAISQELIALDGKRDAAITGINAVVSGFSYHFDANIKQAADLLAASIALYGTSVARLNYQAETAIISNLISDWDNKPELAAAINTLNLQAWKAELATVNSAFSTRYLDRTQEYGDASTDTLKLKREETNAAYYALRDRINALDTLVETPPSPYITVINQVNASIDLYNALIKNTPEGQEEPPTDPADILNP